MNIEEYILLFVSVTIAGLLYFIFRKSNTIYLKLSLSFTGSYLFTISMVHLLPSVFSSGTEHIGYFILIGFFIQLLLEYFSQGIEHGHIHVHDHHTNTFPITMMAGLCVHSFLEGMPLAGNFENGQHNSSLLAGILLHHLPVAFALVSMLAASGLSRTWTIINLVIFASMAPAGALFSTILSETAILNLSSYYNEIMAVVIGIFLHISTTILFESSSDHRFNLYKLVVIVFGAGIAVMM